MELGGKGSAITSTTMISTKTVEVIKPHTKLYPDSEAKPESDPSTALFPIKNENQGSLSIKQLSTGNARRTTRLQPENTWWTDASCEFMAGGEEGTLGALKCAACNCHRSFHRKEVCGHRSSKQDQLMINRAFYSSNSSYKAMQPRGMHPTVEIGRRTSSSSEDMKKILSHRNKNVRTKISEEQKEKMKEFAERLGWRMQKKDEEEIDKFCRMVNLKRQVFKVWMHNNKQAMKRNSNTSE